MPTKEMKAIAFNQQEAALYLGISPGLLKKKRLNGEGPSYCRVGKRVVYLQGDLDAFLEQHRITTTGR